jgi:hypothetical protein
LLGNELDFNYCGLLKSKHEKKEFSNVKKEKIGTFNIDVVNVLNMHGQTHP